MTDVSLKAFRFALPTQVEINSESCEQVKAHTEFPQEFFGLPAMEQVSVVNALLRAAKVHIDDMPPESRDFSNGGQWSPIYIGISVVLRKTPRLTIDAEFNLPDRWKDIPLDTRKKVLRSFAYLMQSTGISIVEREERYGALHA